MWAWFLQWKWRSRTSGKPSDSSFHCLWMTPLKFLEIPTGGGNSWESGWIVNGILGTRYKPSGSWLLQKKLIVQKVPVSLGDPSWFGWPQLIWVTAGTLEQSSEERLSLRPKKPSTACVGDCDQIYCWYSEEILPVQSLKEAGLEAGNRSRFGWECTGWQPLALQNAQEQSPCGAALGFYFPVWWSECFYSPIPKGVSPMVRLDLGIPYRGPCQGGNPLRICLQPWAPVCPAGPIPTNILYPLQADMNLSQLAQLPISGIYSLFEHPESCSCNSHLVFLS